MIRVRNILVIVLAISLSSLMLLDFVYSGYFGYFDGNTGYNLQPLMRLNYGNSSLKWKVLNFTVKLNSSTEFPAVEDFKKSWKGDCPYPKYIKNTALEKESWFPRFLHHLQKVKLTGIPKNREKAKCCWYYILNTFDQFFSSVLNCRGGG